MRGVLDADTIQASASPTARSTGATWTPIARRNPPMSNPLREAVSLHVEGSCECTRVCFTDHTDPRCADARLRAAADALESLANGWRNPVHYMLPVGIEMAAKAIREAAGE